MVSIAFICFAVPLVLMLPVLHRKARWLIGFLLVGSYLTVCAGTLNGVVRDALGITSLELSLTIAPIVEELLKALPVLIYALTVSDRRDDVLAIAFSCGVGFAITENAYLMMQASEAASVTWALVRGLATSLMHGLCTLTIGVGITYVRTQRKLFYTGIFGLLAAAITYHATFNLLVSASGAWSLAGLALPLATYGIALAAYALRRRRAATAQRS